MKKKMAAVFVTFNENPFNNGIFTGFKNMWYSNNPATVIGLDNMEEVVKC